MKVEFVTFYHTIPDMEVNYEGDFISIVDTCKKALFKEGTDFDDEIVQVDLQSIVDSFEKVAAGTYQSSSNEEITYRISIFE